MRPNETLLASVRVPTVCNTQELRESTKALIQTVQLGVSRRRSRGVGMTWRYPVVSLLVMKHLLRSIAVAFAVPVLVMSFGCSSAKIAALESLGYAKREQLVSRVDDARDSQVAAKKQFESALAEFLAVTGGAQTKDLEARYSKLKSSYEASESKAESVRSRIKDVERVSEALFKEWNKELTEYSSDAMRTASAQQLAETRGQYDRLIGVMKNASTKMDPVLAAFKDQVLFLKHNLNARAIASLQGTAATIQTDVSSLVREMEISISEADAFIKQMQSTDSKS